MTRHPGKHQRVDDDLQTAAEQLMTEFEDVPLVIVARALSEARQTTTQWLGRPDPAAMYRLAAWYLAESRLTPA